VGFDRGAIPMLPEHHYMTGIAGVCVMAGAWVTTVIVYQYGPYLLTL